MDNLETSGPNSMDFYQCLLATAYTPTKVFSQNLKVLNLWVPFGDIR